jgi:phosphoribosyl-AMP cyclohydrolase
MSSFLDEIAWNSDGLAPVVAQEAKTGKLLMQAWVNREALAIAVEERRAVYWSRSRNKLWRKGEESGNVQKLIDVFLDCDNDAICYSVEQVGEVACHTGRVSCFHKRLTDGDWEIEEPVLKDPGSMYNK